MSSDCISVQICGRPFACSAATETATPLSFAPSTKNALVSLLKSLAIQCNEVVNLSHDADDAEARSFATYTVLWAIACLCYTTLLMFLERLYVCVPPPSTGVRGHLREFVARVFAKSTHRR